MNDWIQDFPSDRFDQCGEYNPRGGERCTHEAEHGGAHSFGCATCMERRDEDEQHGRPLFPSSAPCPECGETR